MQKKCYKQKKMKLDKVDSQNNIEIYEKLNQISEKILTDYKNAFEVLGNGKIQ